MSAGGAGWRFRARMLSTTSALQAPLSSASAQAASTASRPVLLNRREDPHELAVAVVAARQPGPHTAERPGQLPALEGRAVAQRAGLARQDRHVVPRHRRRSDRARSSGGARRRSRRPGGWRSDRHRTARRPAAPRRGRVRCNGCCRSAPGRSWTPPPRWRESRRRGRDTPSGRTAHRALCARGRATSNTCHTVLPGIVGCGRFLASSRVHARGAHDDAPIHQPPR